MKKIALLAAAALAALATPAFAGGYVGADYGNTSGDGSDINTLQVEGAWGGAGANWGGQIDGAYGSLDDGSDDINAWTLAGHLYWKSDNFRFGVVALTTQLDVDVLDASETSYGLEGTYNFGANTELNASATTGTVSVIGTDIDAWNVDAGINYYFSDNIRVGGKLGVGNLSASGVDEDTQSILLDGEFQPWTAPVSIALSYDHFDSGDSLGVQTDTFRIGARWNFGGGTLRDRNNATPFDTRSAFYQRVYGLR